MLQLLSSYVIFMLKTLITYILKEIKNTIKIKHSYVFLACLLMLLADFPCFYFGGPVAIAIGLTVSYPIGDAVLIASKIAIS